MRRVIAGRVKPMCNPNATLGLRAFFQVSIVIIGLFVAAGIVGILLLLASFLEKHQAAGTADWLNYAIMAGVIYHAEDVPADDALPPAQSDESGDGVGGVA
jgi:hypothetical protein